MCLDELLSTKMEANSCRETHLANMHRIQESLVYVWDYEMTDGFVVARWGVAFALSLL
jgi:hypothetical protein